MAVREYTTTDVTQLEGLTLGSFADAPFTIFSLFKPANVTGDKNILDVTASGHLLVQYMSGAGGWIGGNVGDTQPGGGNTIVEDVWNFFAIAWTGPSPDLVRFHIGELGSTITHSNGGAWAGDSNGAEDVFFGNAVAMTPNHRMAVSAIISGALSDGQIEAINTNAATAYIESTFTVLGGWEFNQASTSTPITDWTGNGADQISQTGTTVITTDDPAWAFGLEEVAEPQSYYATRRRSWR